MAAQLIAGIALSVAGWSLLLFDGELVGISLLVASVAVGCIKVTT